MRISEITGSAAQLAAHARKYTTSVQYVRRKVSRSTLSQDQVNTIIMALEFMPGDAQLSRDAMLQLAAEAGVDEHEMLSYWGS